MKTSEQINELAAALAAAQGEIDNAIADSENPHFKSTYADLASVRRAIRAPLAKHGLSIIQLPTTIEGKPWLTTRLLHKSGQWIEDACQLLVEKPTMQGLGSAITYMRRYATEAVTGIAEQDDDGNEASKHPAGQTKTKKSPPADPGSSTAPGADSKEKKLVTEAQIKRLYALIGAGSERGWDKERVEELSVAAFGLKESFAELTMAAYDKLTGWIEKSTYDETLGKLQAWLAEQAKLKGGAA